MGPGRLGALNSPRPPAAFPAKRSLQQIWITVAQQKAGRAFKHFVAAYEAKYEKAVECLAKDREDLLAFYDYPAEHWRHLRTTNPIESVFATVRLRTVKTRGCLSWKTTFAMVLQLVLSAQEKWRRLNGPKRLAQVIEGVQFRNGIQEVRRAALIQRHHNFRASDFVTPFHLVWIVWMQGAAAWGWPGWAGRRLSRAGRPTACGRPNGGGCRGRRCACG